MAFEEEIILDGGEEDLSGRGRVRGVWVARKLNLLMLLLVVMLLLIVLLSEPWERHGGVEGGGGCMGVLLAVSPGFGAGNWEAAVIMREEGGGELAAGGDEVEMAWSSVRVWVRVGACLKLHFCLAPPQPSAWSWLSTLVPLLLTLLLPRLSPLSSQLLKLPPVSLFSTSVLLCLVSDDGFRGLDPGMV